MSERYVPIRPGIAEHLLRGDISVLEFGIYVIIHLQADYRTGIWRGSAPRILNSAPRGAKLREIQRALEQLTKKGLLKHFHQHGQRGNFSVLIDKFTVRSGALKGKRLNAKESLSLKTISYDSCADVDTDDDAQDAPIQEVRSKKEEKPIKPTPASAPPDLPVWIPEPTWRAFSEMRDNMRAPLTLHGSLLIFKKLASWMEKGQSPQEVLEQSIESGWRSVYELKKEGSRNGKGPISADEAQRRTIENFGGVG